MTTLLICDGCGRDITREKHYITEEGDICSKCKMRAYQNYLKAHGFTESEGWDDDYHADDFSKNWVKYIRGNVA